MHQYLMHPVEDEDGVKWQLVTSTYLRPKAIQDYWAERKDGGGFERLVQYWDERGHLVERVTIV